MNKKGFTLMEMVVVIVILAILGLMLFPSILAYLSNSQAVVCKNNMKTIMQSYYANVIFDDNNSSFDELVQESLEGTKATSTVSGTTAKIIESCPKGGEVTLSMSNGIVSLECSLHGRLSGSEADAAKNAVTSYLENFDMSILAGWSGQNKYNSVVAGFNGGNGIVLTDEMKDELFPSISTPENMYLYPLAVVVNGQLQDVQFVSSNAQVTPNANVYNYRAYAIIVNGTVYAHYTNANQDSLSATRYIDNTNIAEVIKYFGTDSHAGKTSFSSLAEFVDLLDGSFTKIE